MKCPKCNFEIPVGSRFCARCGFKLDKPVPPPPAPAPVPVEDPFKDIDIPSHSEAPAEQSAPQPQPAPEGQAPQEYRQPTAYQQYERPVQPTRQNKKNNKAVLWICIAVCVLAVLLTVGIIVGIALFGSDKDSSDKTPPVSVSSAEDHTPAPDPTAEPSAEPTTEPTAEPTPEPTAEPTAKPAAESTAEPTPVSAAAAGTSGDYLLPQSSSRYLTYEDIEHLSNEEKILARNEIFARLGRKFDTDWIRAYFESKPWYEGTIEPEDFQRSMMSDIEIYNVQFIQSYEE